MASASWRMVAGILLACIGSGGAGRAQTPQAAQTISISVGLPSYRARVLGVFDETSGGVIEGVRVLDLATGLSALTTTTGTVSLVFLPDGGSLVRLQKLGYAPQTMPVAISTADTNPLTVVMHRVAELPTVVSKGAAPSKYLSPALGGFEERRRQRISGVFIDDSILRRNEGRRLADLLRAYGNALIREGQNGATFLLRAPRCGAGGPPQLYLDGVPLGGPASNAVQVPARGRAAATQPTVLPFDLSQYDLSTLAGVEYYADGDMMPIEFAHTSQRCGALLLWTRER